MTASTVARPPRTSSLAARVAGAVRARSAEALVFSVATLLALLHALDDAFLLPKPGVPLTQHALAAGIAVAASALAIWRFPTMRPGLRSATAFAFGALAMLNGGRHAYHITVQDMTTANDVTGLVALAAGVVLVGLAAWIPFRHRGEGDAGPVRRWAIRLLVPVGFVLGAITVFGPVGMALTDIHSLQKPLGDKPNAAYETVHFTTSDGVELEGWYRPSRNGASVLVMSGGGSNRTGALRHAKLLERQGYGVLVYDPRGMGHSGGTVNSYAWGWDKDADAAVKFVKSQPDVEDGRIGALGLSSGADAAIDYAGRRHDLRAVVADGAAAIGYEDIKEYIVQVARPPADVGAVQDDRGHPGPLAAQGLARRPHRGHASAAPGHLCRRAGEGVGRALRPRRRRAEPALVPAEGQPHRRAQAVPRAVRAAGDDLLRASPRVEAPTGIEPV